MYLAIFVRRRVFIKLVVVIGVIYIYNDDNDGDANDNDDDDDERKRCHDKRSLRALETINGISWHSLAGLHSIP